MCKIHMLILPQHYASLSKMINSLSIRLEAGRGMSAETCGFGMCFVQTTRVVGHMHNSLHKWLKYVLSKRHKHTKRVAMSVCWIIWYCFFSCLVSNVYSNCIVQDSLHHIMSSQVKSNKFIAIYTYMKILSPTNMDPTYMTTRDEGSIAYWSLSY